MIKRTILLFSVSCILNLNYLYAQQKVDLIIDYEIHYKDQLPKNVGMDCDQTDYRENTTVPLTIQNNTATGSFTKTHSSHCLINKAGARAEITTTQTTKNSINGTLQNNFLNLVIYLDQTETAVIKVPGAKSMTQTSSNKDEKNMKIEFKDGAAFSQSFSLGKVTTKLTATLKICTPKSDKISFVILPFKEDLLNLKYTSDHSKTSEQIALLKKENPEKLDAGLTIINLQPKIKSSDVISSDGKTYYITGLELQFEIPKIFIESKYPVASCPYIATYAHELEHAESFKNILIKYYDKMKCALSSFPFPSKDNPLKVKDEKEAKEIMERYIQAAFNEVRREMKNELLKIKNELDKPASAQKVYDKCPLLQWK